MSRSGNHKPSVLINVSCRIFNIFGFPSHRFIFIIIKYVAKFVVHVTDSENL
jgi:hypothetical protein